MMSKIKWCCFLGMVMSCCSVDAHAKDFSWEMFLPALTNQCRPSNLVSCKDQVNCEDRGGYWYDNSCHADPPTCSVNFLDLCTSEQTCIAVGDYWYELGCHLDQSPNFINTEKLGGDWWFMMNVGLNNRFDRYYAMNKNTLQENPAGSGLFTIEGTEHNSGDMVIGRYVPGDDNYTMFVTKTTIDVLYEFTFTAETEVSGCYYEIDKDDGSQGPCIPMVGGKLQ